MPFPPERTRARSKFLEDMFRLSSGDYAGNSKFDDTRRLKQNYFRFINNFWADTIFGDPPVIGYEDNSRTDDFISALTPSLMRAGRLVVADMVRYGVGCFHVREPMVMENIDPRYWFPVRLPFDVFQPGPDIIAYPYVENFNGVGSTPDRLFTVTYENGQAIRKIYKLEGLQIGTLLEEMQEQAAPMAVIPARNGEGFFGISDYVDIIDYVAEIHRRESRMSEALDLHLKPHLALPEASISVERDGSVRISKDGEVIPVPEGQSLPPSFVSWNPQFVAHNEAIIRSEKRVLSNSRIAIILTSFTGSEQDLVANVPSGAALRRLAIQTVNRIRLLRETLYSSMKDAIEQAVSLYAIEGEVLQLEKEKISIQWPAELSGGLTDEAEALARLVDTGIIDRATAIQLTGKVKRSEAETQADQFEAGQRRGQGSPSRNSIE